MLDGLRRRYGGKRIVSDTGADVPLAQVQAKVEEGLSIIADVGYEDYILMGFTPNIPRARHRSIYEWERGRFAGLLLSWEFRTWARSASACFLKREVPQHRRAWRPAPASRPT